MLKKQHEDLKHQRLMYILLSECPSGQFVGAKVVHVELDAPFLGLLLTMQKRIKKIDLQMKTINASLMYAPVYIWQYASTFAVEAAVEFLSLNQVHRTLNPSSKNRKAVVFKVQ